MKLALSLLLIVPGVLLLATAWMPLGLAAVYAGWWVYERSGWRSSDALAITVLVLGGAGGAAIVVQFVMERLP